MVSAINPDSAVKIGFYAPILDLVDLVDEVKKKAYLSGEVHFVHNIQRINLKSAVERGSFDQTMDEMDIVDPVDFTRKGIDFLVHFVHKVHDIQRIARRIRS